MGGGGKVEERQATPSVVPRPCEFVNDYIQRQRMCDVMQCTCVSIEPTCILVFSVFPAPLITHTTHCSETGGVPE